jgi:hypothetical protein
LPFGPPDAAPREGSWSSPPRPPGAFGENSTPSCRCSFAFGSRRRSASCCRACTTAVRT